MNHDANDDPVAEPPYYPSGYSPETNENASGYDAMLMARRSEFSGPIPPPESLEHYERILPGAAHRILGMAERNAQSFRDANARHVSLEETTEHHRHKEISHGQLFGLVTVLAMCLLAGFSLASGHPAVAGIVCSTTIAAVAAVFVTGRRPVEPEKKEGPE